MLINFDPRKIGKMGSTACKVLFVSSANGIIYVIFLLFLRR